MKIEFQRRFFNIKVGKYVTQKEGKPWGETEEEEPWESRQTHVKL
jgi:hypothetical protein